MRTRNSLKKSPSRNSTPRKAQSPRNKRGSIVQDPVVDEENSNENSTLENSSKKNEEKPSTSYSLASRRTPTPRKKRGPVVEEPVVEAENSNENSIVENSPEKNEEIPSTSYSLASGKEPTPRKKRGPIVQKPVVEVEVSDENLTGDNSPEKNKEKSPTSNSRSYSRTPSPRKKRGEIEQESVEDEGETSLEKSISNKSPGESIETPGWNSSETFLENNEENSLLEDDSVEDLGDVDDKSHENQSNDANNTNNRIGTNELTPDRTPEPLSAISNPPEENSREEPIPPETPLRTSSKTNPRKLDSEVSQKKKSSKQYGSDKKSDDSRKLEKTRKEAVYPVFKVKYNEEQQEDIFECPKCYKEFPTRKQIRRHYRIHVEEKKYVCTRCDVKFLSKSDFKCHNETFNHSNKKLYECSFCVKPFTTKYLCRQHENTHKGLRFRCKGCWKSYIYKRDLVRHVRLHHLDLDPSEDTKLVSVSDDETPQDNSINASPSRASPSDDFPSRGSMKKISKKVFPAEVVEAHIGEEPEIITGDLDMYEDSEGGHESETNIKSPKNSPEKTVLAKKRRYEALETSHNAGSSPKDENKLLDSKSESIASNPVSTKKRKKKPKSKGVIPAETEAPSEIINANHSLTNEADDVTVESQVPEIDKHECPVCNRLFNSIQKLRKHLMKKHSIDAI